LTPATIIKNISIFLFLAISRDHLNFFTKEPSWKIPKPGTGERTFREHSANLPRTPKPKNLSDPQK
jgi:hypothetical protein